MVNPIYIVAFWGLNYEYHHQFEASLDYIVSSQPDWAIE